MGCIQPVNASPIHFTQTGLSGSGSVGGSLFTNRSFTFSATGETDHRVDIPGVGYYIDHLFARVNIEGVGVLDIVTPTFSFVNNSFGLVGFSRSGGDLYNGPIDSSFGIWDMLSSIGPIGGATTLLQWNLAPVETSAGIITFSTGNTSGTFRAQVDIPAIPEVPAPPALLGIYSCFFYSRKLRKRIKSSKSPVASAID